MRVKKIDEIKGGMPPTKISSNNINIIPVMMTMYYYEYGTVSILNYALYSTGTVYLMLTIVNTTMLPTHPLGAR
jgi:hypothetical protein